MAPLVQEVDRQSAIDTEAIIVRGSNLGVHRVSHALAEIGVEYGERLTTPSVHHEERPTFLSLK